MLNRQRCIWYLVILLAIQALFLIGSVTYICIKAPGMTFQEMYWNNRPNRVNGKYIQT